MMASEVVELQRNPQISSLAELEEKFKKIFNVSKVIWLKKGLADDNQTFVGKFPDGSFPSAGTGGHIDEVSKITGNHLLWDVTYNYSQVCSICWTQHNFVSSNFRIRQRF